MGGGGGEARECDGGASKQVMNSKMMLSQGHTHLTLEQGWTALNTHTVNRTHTRLHNTKAHAHTHTDSDKYTWRNTLEITIPHACTLLGSWVQFLAGSSRSPVSQVIHTTTAACRPLTLSCFTACRKDQQSVTL